MNQKEFYEKFDEVLGTDPGTVTGKEDLGDPDMFDSIAIMEILVFLDEDLEIEMTPEQIQQHGSVEALYKKLFP